MEPLDETLRGQGPVWELMFAYVDSMALNCAVELRIPDIIHSQGGSPVTLAQIASRIPSPSAQTSCLASITRLLVRKNIFSAHCNGEETLYGLTALSRWLMQGAAYHSLMPLVLLAGHQRMVSLWHYLSDYIKDGGSIAFKRANGGELWDLESEDPEFSRVFRDAMACSNKLMMKAIVDAYKDGFERVGSLVVVGGGTGSAVSEIVRSHPHIKGINFDQPHIVTAAPAHGGVCHAGGDVKWILHDWTDEDCVRILKNCRKAVSEKNGKVIIADVVLPPEGNGPFDETGIASDLLIITQTGGKETTEQEWKKILEEGGFPRCNIIQIPSLVSIIEAFPV